MAHYSKKSQELARQLAEKAAANLRRAGWTVTVDPKTGVHSLKRPSEKS